MDVAVLGLGKLGSCMATLYASRGHNVYCYDIDFRVRRSVVTGTHLPKEPGLQQLWKERHDRIHVCTSDLEACQNAEIVFVIVPSPSLDSNMFSPEIVLRVVQAFGMACGKEHKTCVVVSTLTPGHSSQLMIPAIEQVTGSQHGDGWSYVYSPEFIALGDVIHGLLCPDYVLMGTTTGEWNSILCDFYRSVTSSPLTTTTLINAEMAKLAVNCALTTRIAYGNMIAEICGNVPGADASVVLGIVGGDRRIGRSLIMPGGPSSGPCLPRDIRCLQAFAHQHNTQADLIESVRITDEHWVQLMARAVINRTPDVFAVLGTSYTKRTPVTEEAQGLLVARAVSKHHDCVIQYHDPNPPPLELVVKAADKCVYRADAVLIAVPHDEYKTLKPDVFKEGALVLDVWGILDSLEIRERCDYRRWGKDPIL